MSKFKIHPCAYCVRVNFFEVILKKCRYALIKIDDVY